MTANRIGYWLETGERRYWVEIDRERTLLEASIEIKAHDKAATLRRITHDVTLARLQALVRPAAKCPHCGAAQKEAA